MVYIIEKRLQLLVGAAEWKIILYYLYCITTSYTILLSLSELTEKKQYDGENVDVKFCRDLLTIVFTSLLTLTLVISFCGPEEVAVQVPNLKLALPLVIL